MNFVNASCSPYPIGMRKFADELEVQLRSPPRKEL
jgi:hypothetical protein